MSLWNTQLFAWYIYNIIYVCDSLRHKQTCSLVEFDLTKTFKAQSFLGIESVCFVKLIVVMKCVDLCFSLRHLANIFSAEVAEISQAWRCSSMFGFFCCFQFNMNFWTWLLQARLSTLLSFVNGCCLFFDEIHWILLVILRLMINHVYVFYLCVWHVVSGMFVQYSCKQGTS